MAQVAEIPYLPNRSSSRRYDGALQACDSSYKRAALVRDITKPQASSKST
jgi:hypothetical protein